MLLMMRPTTAKVEGSFSKAQKFFKDNTRGKLSDGACCRVVFALLNRTLYQTVVDRHLATAKKRSRSGDTPTKSRESETLSRDRGAAREGQ